MHYLVMSWRTGAVIYRGHNLDDAAEAMVPGTVCGSGASQLSAHREAVKQIDKLRGRPAPPAKRFAELRH